MFEFYLLKGEIVTSLVFSNDMIDGLRADSIFYTIRLIMITNTDSAC